MLPMLTLMCRALCLASPVVFLDLGRIDIEALTRSGVDLKAVLRRHIRVWETVARLLAKGGATSGAQRGSGYLFVIDVRDGTARRFLAGWRLWADIAACEAKYYPEMLAAVCVLRAPSVAEWAVGMCKRGFLDRPTAQKITLDSSDDPTPVLTKLLPPALIAQLPPALVGAGSPGAGSSAGSRRVSA